MCSPLTDMVLLKILCLFVHCVVCNRWLRVLLRFVRLSGVRYSGRHRERLCVSGLCSPELSVQVGRPNSFTSYSQGYDKGVPMAPRPKLFVVRWGWRLRCLLIGCAPFGAKAWLSHSNAIYSRHTKPLSSPNCRWSCMWELSRHCR